MALTCLWGADLPLRRQAHRVRVSQTGRSGEGRLWRWARMKVGMKSGEEIRGAGPQTSHVQGEAFHFLKRIQVIFTLLLIFFFLKWACDFI